MISPEKHVFQRLITTPAIARLIGFQVYPLAVPKSAVLPFVVYKRQNIIRESSLTGPLLIPMVSLQIASWALTHDGARELSNEIRIALDGNIGDLAGVTIQDMRLVSETDDYIDPAAVSSQLPPAYEVRQLFQIRWSEQATE